MTAKNTPYFRLPLRCEKI